MIHGLSEFIKRFFTSVILLGCFGGAYLHSEALFCFFLSAVLAIILLFEWPHLAPPKTLIFWFLTIFYPIIPVCALLWLTITFRANDFWLPLYPFFIAWTSDTCGYFVGNLIGKHKMWPSLSPGKTWEGFIGGVVGVSIIHFLMLPHTQLLSAILQPWAPYSTLSLALCMTSISVLGGFFLSFLKRRRGLKDAGTILPGHGGFLDRFDGVFFVAVATIFMLVLQ